MAVVRDRLEQLRPSLDLGIEVPAFQMGSVRNFHPQGDLDVYSGTDAPSSATPSSVMNPC
jgi:hypothetical protein